MMMSGSGGSSDQFIARTLCFLALQSWGRWKRGSSIDSMRVEQSESRWDRCISIALGVSKVQRRG